MHIIFHLWNQYLKVEVVINLSMTSSVWLNYRDFIKQCCYFWTWCYSGTACKLFPQNDILTCSLQYVTMNKFLYSFECEQWFKSYQVIATAVSTSLVDKTGRRILLIVSLYKNREIFFFYKICYSRWLTELLLFVAGLLLWNDYQSLSCCSGILCKGCAIPKTSFFDKVLCVHVEHQ